MSNSIAFVHLITLSRRLFFKFLLLLVVRCRKVSSCSSLLLQPASVACCCSCRWVLRIWVYRHRAAELRSQVAFGGEFVVLGILSFFLFKLEQFAVDVLHEIHHRPVPGTVFCFLPSSPFSFSSLLFPLFFFPSSPISSFFLLFFSFLYSSYPSRSSASSFFVVCILLPPSVFSSFFSFLCFFSFLLPSLLFLLTLSFPSLTTHSCFLGRCVDDIICLKEPKYREKLRLPLPFQPYVLAAPVGSGVLCICSVKFLFLIPGFAAGCACCLFARLGRRLRPRGRSHKMDVLHTISRHRR